MVGARVVPTVMPVAEDEDPEVLYPDFPMSGSASAWLWVGAGLVAFYGAVALMVWLLYLVAQ